MGEKGEEAVRKRRATVLLQVRQIQLGELHRISPANSPIDDVSRWTIFMKEITPEQNEIHFVVSGDFENLFEGS